MFNVFSLQSNLTLLVLLVLLAVKIFAFINCLLWPAQYFTAAGKLTKPAWAIILGMSLVVQLVGLPLLIDLAFTIAAFVYLADVRPALASLTRRR